MPKKSSGSVQVFYPKYNREEIIQLISSGLAHLEPELPLLLVTLFGSYAQGNYTIASDIDLLVVYRGKKKREAYAVIRRALRIPRLEPHVYSQGEYEKIKDTLQRMTKKGIVLYRRDTPKLED